MIWNFTVFQAQIRFPKWLITLSSNVGIGKVTDHYLNLIWQVPN